MSAPRYRAPAAGALRIVPLDDLIAIHHRPSGQTHLVASPVPEILAELGETWTEVDTLLTRLATAYDMLDSDAAALAARLEELAEAGLVERA